MNYYPVAIPTLNRYEHFRQCIESLSVCTHAEHTELVIGLDFPPSEKYVLGFNQIKAYIPSIKGFKTVTVFEHEKNLGPVGNSNFLADYCFKHYEAYIGTEDDNVFSPCFLDYMDTALDKYKNDNVVMTVSGYNHEEFYDQGSYKTFFSRDSCAWGIGFWRHKVERLDTTFKDLFYFRSVTKSYNKAKKIVTTYPALYQMLCSMVEREQDWGDVKYTTINILQGYRQLHPAVSLARNMGYDGSGVHCGVDNSLSKQVISTDKYFDFGKGVGPTDTENNRRALFYQCLPKEYPDAEIVQIMKLFYHNTVPLYDQYRRIRHYIHICKVSFAGIRSKRKDG